ncbi:hypothetical protein NDN08_002457 [Rhodosorus marinus]|uniref:26S proteasome non-ATPase regulatory subunit 2 homolog n=1 Tax=Rhodosorus marinus TaxID=101924 RepID=A0AAV8UWK8_9RHOD|nr:hypothetical protein NDN08_002457 [Rhodosorus marinus]
MVDSKEVEKGGGKKNAVKDAKKKKDEEMGELSQEDLEKKEQLEMLVERSQDPDPAIQKQALETIRSEIRSATASMTSVPKPLKFLRPLYPKMKEFFGTMPDSDNKVFMADVLSVLAMTMADENTTESLDFKLMGSKDAPQTWGHEYVRHLCGEIRREYAASMDELDPALMGLVKEIVPFLMSSNAEPEACDLLMEVECLSTHPEILADCVDEKNFERVCLYLTSCSNYVAEPEDAQILNTACSLYRKVKKYPQAVRIALRIGDMALVKSIYASCDDRVMKKQLAFDLARQNVLLEDESDAELENIMMNTKLSEQFLSLAKDLEVVEAKTPEDIYKLHLLDSRQPPQHDSARVNLASTFVNAFVNMGFGNDKLVLDDYARWIHRNKEHGMMSASASLGMILLWDVDGGLSKIDKHMYSGDDHVKAGALMAVGIVSAGVRNECDPALALLVEHVDSPKRPIRAGAICGLGLAYAGTQNESVLELLMPIVADAATNPNTVAFAALALGLVYVGSCNEEISATLIQAMTDRAEEGGGSDELASNRHLPQRLMPLALGLLFLGKQEKSEVVAESLTAMVGGTLGKACSATLKACSYAGTGNVLKIQEFLSVCGEHPEAARTEETDESAAKSGDQKQAAEQIAMEQGISVLGIAIVSMGEELGAEMAMRAFGHLLQYGDAPVRRGVPLAMGLVSVSNPQLMVVDTLSKLTHDADQEVAQGAILSLGLVGAGTNNSRIAALLRQLSSYYHKDPQQLLLVRLAQGLLHAAKGLVTMNPFYSENLLLNPIALGGLLTVLFCSLDMKGIILGKFHYLLYFLSLSSRPRMVFTVDEDLNPLPVNIRVGQAVDTVGQAGHPKTITGFQTHTSPVLLAAGERAELATEEYLPIASVLEGCVILKKNPDYVEE